MNITDSDLPHTRRPPLYPSWLPLLSFPVLLAAEAIQAPSLAVFLLAILAIVSLASRMGQATEELAAHFGSTFGGFLNATFGNAAEFIIAFAAINAGLSDLVKASLTGSIVGNVLFVVGGAFFFGGLRYREQSFDVRSAGLNSTMLLIAVISMLVPSAFFFFSPDGSGTSLATEELSLFVAILMISIYVLSLVFSFHTHSYLFRKRTHAPPTTSRNAAIATLFIATLALAVTSEIFAQHLEGVTRMFDFSQLFMGAVVVALVGNAAEHLGAVAAAKKNDIDLALAITIGSSIQIALLVAPLLVLISFALGKPMNMVFTLFEMLAVFASVFIINEIASDGQCNWFEGVQLMVMYLLLAGLFFFVR